MSARRAASAVAANAPDAAKAPWRLAFALAFAAVLSGILLTGVSVWFLGAVALAGLGPAAFAFNFHFPAALVRLFALTKTAAKYGERIVGHQAALTDQVRRRVRLFAAMAAAPSVRAVGWQLGNQDRLSDYMEDVEDVDFARLRVDMPAATLTAAAAALIIATLWLVPLAIVPIALLALATATAMRWAMPRASRDWDRVRASQRAAGRRLGSVFAAAVPLQAEAAWSERLGAAFAHFADAQIAQLGERRALAVLDAVAGFLGPFAALSVLLAAWHAGIRGGALLIPAFVAFAWLALGETVQGLSRVALGRVRERAARQALDRWTAGAAVASPHSPSALSSTLSLEDVPLQAPDGRVLGGAVNLTLATSRPTALVGPSGAGKTTLLKQIAGWIGADNSGRFVSGGAALDRVTRSTTTHLSLHDAAVLSDTVRENLFAPNASATECLEALAAVELEGRVRAAGGLDAWISQDMLSLGEAQRLNLARTLLTDAPVVLLDEPTEHLDAEQAARILRRVLRGLAGRIVVYATHDVAAAGEAAAVVACGAVPKRDVPALGRPASAAS